MPPALAILNRTFNDRSTPKATTISLIGSESRSHGQSADRSGNDSSHNFTDYDEGDILDELIQGPTTPAPTSSLDDDTASTCSSTTVRSSVSARSRSSRSDTSATSISGSSVCSSAGASIAPPRNIAQPGRTVPGAATGGGRRRRRRNRSGAASVAPSEAESLSPPPSPKISRPQKPGKAPKGADEKINAQPKQQTAKTVPEAAPATSTALPIKRGQKGRRKTVKSSGSALVDSARRSKAPRLQIGLDLDVELQLKSKVRGDICLTLVLEETHKVAPRASPEIRPNAAGQYVAYDEWEDMEQIKEEEDKVYDEEDPDVQQEIEIRTVKRGATQGKATAPRAARREICHLRVGRLNLTRRWWMDGYEMLSRFPPPVVAGVAVTLPVATFAAGWAVAQWAGFWV